MNATIELLSEDLCGLLFGFFQVIVSSEYKALFQILIYHIIYSMRE